MNTKLINASAGTGKTYSLTEEIVSLLKSGEVSADRMLITTFTEKAAEELVGRVRSALLENDLIEAARKLPLARIGTVNSICDRFVREFAYELGLSPAVEVASEIWATTLLREAMNNAATTAELQRLSELTVRMSGAESSIRTGGNGKTDWHNAVEQIVNLARSNGLGPEDLKEFRQRSWEELQGQCFSGEVIPDLQQHMCDALNQCEKFSMKNQKVRDAMLSSTYTWGDWQKTADFPDRDQHVKDIAEKVLQHPELRKDMEDQLSLVYTIAARTLELYQARKQALSVIDFIDQEVHTLQLLNRPDISQEIKTRFDVVMVDEFQDTSPLQLAIFLQLKALIERTVWVGDPKQSIYGFRGADPQLMTSAAHALETDGAELHTLQYSWRSRGPLCDLTSEWFVPAYAAAQGMPAGRVKIEAASELGEEPAGVREAVSKWQLTGTNAETRLAALTDGIQGLLSNQEPDVWVPQEKQPNARPVKPKDLAILCRTNTQCDQVAQALVQRGIAVNCASKGLLATPEARLVIAGLKRWLSRHDKLAEAEITRLTLLSEDREEAWLNDLLSEEAVPETMYWVERLDKARELAANAGVSVVFETVLATLPVSECLLRWGNYAQRVANLEALRSHLNTYLSEVQGPGLPRTLSGFVVYLEKLKDRKDGDLGGARHGDAVSVLTLHKAKGLEWPVVILFGWEDIKQQTAFNVSLQRPGLFDVLDPLKDRWIRYWPNPLSSRTKNALLFEHTADENESAMNEEHRNWLNLAYVGMTRAATQLILIVPKKEQKLPFLQIEVEAVTPPNATADTVQSPVAISWYAEPTGPEEHEPARIQPSSIKDEGTLGAITELGERFDLTGTPPSDQLGNAIHNFFAAAETMPEDDIPALALKTLQARQVDEHLDATALVEMRNRLLSWIETTYSTATRYVEWPVTCFIKQGSFMDGRIDLLLDTPDGWVIIDHKFFPGNRAQLEQRAAEYAGQLTAYSAALTAATGRPVVSSWIHFSMVGLMVEVQD